MDMLLEEARIILEMPYISGSIKAFRSLSSEAKRLIEPVGDFELGRRLLDDLNDSYWYDSMYDYDHEDYTYAYY